MSMWQQTAVHIRSAQSKPHPASRHVRTSPVTQIDYTYTHSERSRPLIALPSHPHIHYKPVAMTTNSRVQQRFILCMFIRPGIQRKSLHSLLETSQVNYCAVHGCFQWSPKIVVSWRAVQRQSPIKASIHSSAHTMQLSPLG